MKQGRIALALLSITFLLSGCFTPRTGGSKRLLGLIPIPGTGTTDTLTEGDPSYAWMFQLLAVGSIAFAIGSSWLAKQVTRSGMIVFIAGIATSFWGLSMGAIQRSAGMYIPWVVALVLAVGAIDVGLRLRTRWLNTNLET